jgi:signal transduction histidine kinase
MSTRWWRDDTIARRIAIAEVLAIAATLILVFLFNALAGVWSQDPLDKSPLIAEGADLVRVIEVSPPEIRERLCAAATTPTMHVDWYAAGSVAAQSLAAIQEGEKTERVIRKMFADTHHVVTVTPENRALRLANDPHKGGTWLQMPYTLGIRLADGSWLTFGLPHRMWGLPQFDRWIIRILFMGLSIPMIAGLMARQFAKPVKRLAEAVREFGLNPAAPPMATTGPRELRQVVTTFNAMQAQIQKFVAYRTMMLAAISHDLRTPLTRMRLRGEYIEDADQQARLFRDVDEMQAMIDGALAFFRGDASAEERTQFDLPQLLLTIAHDFKDRGIQLNYSGPDHAAYWGPPLELTRAVTNLIDNALKYATAPDIELTRTEEAFIVRIQDRGPGIPPDAIERVFRPYYRLDKSRNRGTGGVGLGLTVAQAIVQRLGGQIFLANRPGGGLEASIFLPFTA